MVFIKGMFFNSFLKVLFNGVFYGKLVTPWRTIREPFGDHKPFENHLETIWKPLENHWKPLENH